MLDFLPVNIDEMTKRGWTQADFVYVCGDSYVDHPSFGVAIITRLLEEMGFKICILAQPNWKDTNAFKEFLEPKYGFIVSSGNVDSMVNHYSVAKIKRKTDFYTYGGIMGKRPDYAVTTYCKKIREAYKNTNIIIGGVEASLRRFAHYDYWSDTVFPSILVDSGADIISYGMGENSIFSITSKLRNGENIKSIKNIRGICYLEEKQENLPKDCIILPSFEEVKSNKKSYAIANNLEIKNQDYAKGKPLAQKHKDIFMVQMPPSKPLSREEMDRVYDRNYMRTYHPMYEKYGGVPSIKEVEFSIVQNRGCFGACNFCAITIHQGKYVTSRSKESILKEATKMTKLNHFKGNIHDVGGPTANFRRPSCNKQLVNGICTKTKCLAPKKCKNLIVDHSEYLDILRSLRKLDGIKKVFIRSGIRFDYLLYGEDYTFLKEVVKHHTSGQLKVAPEHICDNVLYYMGKPSDNLYETFSKKFYEYTKSMNKKQYLVPYLMSSHPGSTIKDAINLAIFLKKHNIRPEQVQDFYPTPATESTCMYYTGLDPRTLEPIYIPKTRQEKKEQRALLQYYSTKNRDIIEKILKRENRYDLIGNDSKCLIKKGKHKPSVKDEIVINFDGDVKCQKNTRTKNTKTKNTKRKKN